MEKDSYDFSRPGTLLSHVLLTGVAAPDAWTFTWTYLVGSLDTRSSSKPDWSGVFDLKQSGYAAFDNLSIVSSDQAGLIDRNNDGIPDQVCPSVGPDRGAVQP
jgi:hypothetical protein